MPQDKRKERFEEIAPRWHMTDADADKLIRSSHIGNVGTVGVGMIVDEAVAIGVVVPAENAGMVRDHKGERALHGAAYWQRAAEVAEARIEAVKAIHKPFKVFDECDHDHGDEPADESPDATVVDVDGIGLTCNHMYSICTACCTDDGQTEYCADGHDHGPGKPICPTTAALEKP